MREAALNIATWDGMYASGRSLLAWPDEQVVAALARRRASIRRGLDLACGAGRHALLMARMGIDALGIDSSPAAIAHATRRAWDEGLAARVRFEQGLAQDLALPDAHFDAAICWGLLHYLGAADRAGVLGSLQRLVRPGGVLIATLRSERDSRAREGVAESDGARRVGYFDVETRSPRETRMFFWSEAEARELLAGWSQVSLGHRSIEPVGKLGAATCHWLVEARR